MGKPKFTWAYFFHTCAKFVRNLPILCGLFHPYQCSYKLNRRTLADAQKDLWNFLKITAPYRVCTMPRTLGNCLVVSELIACMVNSINTVDVYFLKMLYTLQNGNEKAIFDIILREGRRRVTQVNIERARGVEGNLLLVKYAQMAVLFNFLKTIQFQPQVITLNPPRTWRKKSKRWTLTTFSTRQFSIVII